MEKRKRWKLRPGRNEAGHEGPCRPPLGSWPLLSVEGKHCAKPPLSLTGTTAAIFSLTQPCHSPASDPSDCLHCTLGKIQAVT